MKIMGGLLGSLGGLSLRRLLQILDLRVRLIVLLLVQSTILHFVEQVFVKLLHLFLGGRGRRMLEEKSLLCHIGLILVMQASYRHVLDILRANANVAVHQASLLPPPHLVRFVLAAWGWRCSGRVEHTVPNITPYGVLL